MPLYGSIYISIPPICYMCDVVFFFEGLFCVNWVLFFYVFVEC